jgi:hypothetical protein
MMGGVFVYGAFLSKGKNVSRRDEAVAAIFTSLLTDLFFLTVCNLVAEYVIVFLKKYYFVKNIIFNLKKKANWNRFI